MLSYLVSQRTAEIGVRMALGADRPQVVGLVARSALRLVSLGLVIGVGGAGIAARVIQSLLFNVTPLDPRVYAVVVLLFAGVATS